MLKKKKETIPSPQPTTEDPKDQTMFAVCDPSLSCSNIYIKYVYMCIMTISSHLQENNSAQRTLQPQLHIQT